MSGVEARDYNYAHFDEYVEAGQEQREFSTFADRLHAGEPAPDFVATRVEDGTEVRASDLWRRQPLVMEFGSFT